MGSEHDNVMQIYYRYICLKSTPLLNVETLNGEEDLRYIHNVHLSS